MDDDLLRNRLAEAFRRSTRNPQHLAFLVQPLVEDLIREAKAEAWDEGYMVGADDQKDWTADTLGFRGATDNPHRD